MPFKQSTEVSFYIVAHADDWQLFMQPNSYNDLVSPGSKVVFIITTAGDAGVDRTYWSAREEGSKSSVRFCLAPFAALAESSGTKEFNGHIIQYWSANNTTHYFMRLPDGNLDGNGFATQGYQSLHKLKTGQINTITSVDNSSAYDSWMNFCTTLQAIIVSESDGLSNVCINYPNPDTAINPDDHIDHVTTGEAIQATAIISSLRQALFVGYDLRKAQEHLPPGELFWKAGMFAAYEKAVFDGSGYSTLHEDINIYLQWCLKSAKFVTANL